MRGIERQLRVAFYAPLKGPDHPVPSGDRAFARLLIGALKRGGSGVEPPSGLRTYLSTPDRHRQISIEADARDEVERIGKDWSSRGGAPDVWFTYHPYYKAPDLLGPKLTRRFGIPYVTAEASHAPKRAAGAWARWHDAAETSLMAADLHFCLTAVDREGLIRLGVPGKLVDLPPFVEISAASATPSPGGRRGGTPVRLITVAMMRPGAKLASYRALAEALRILGRTRDWHLTVIGDGPARDEVRRFFVDLPPDRLDWAGERPADAVPSALSDADLLVWPGLGEAFGMVYLEAGSVGLPALAMRSGGVESVVRDGATGLLTPEGDVPTYAAALGRLIGDPEERRRLGSGARRFVHTERTVGTAADILSDALSPLMERGSRS